MHYTKQELDLVTKDENPICLSRHFSGMDYNKDLTSRLFLPSSISFSFLMQNVTACWSVANEFSPLTRSYWSLPSSKYQRQTPFYYLLIKYFIVWRFTRKHIGKNIMKYHCSDLENKNKGNLFTGCKGVFTPTSAANQMNNSGGVKHRKVNILAIVPLNFNLQICSPQTESVCVA